MGLHAIEDEEGTYCRPSAPLTNRLPLVIGSFTLYFNPTMTKAPTPTHKKSKKQRDTTKRHQNFDYITIADRLRTVSFSNDSHPTVVGKPVYGIPTLPLPQKLCNQKDFVNNPPYKDRGLTTNQSGEALKIITHKLLHITCPSASI